jgi:hypothetical protein
MKRIELLTTHNDPDMELYDLILEKCNGNGMECCAMSDSVDANPSQYIFFRGEEVDEDCDEEDVEFVGDIVRGAGITDFTIELKEADDIKAI